MHWIAPSEKNADNAALEKRLWDAADQLRANSEERATGDLCRMNLAVHGLEGDIKQAISYYDDPHDATGRFDFVLANPPFNVNAVDKERLKDQVGPNRRFPFGLK